MQQTVEQLTRWRVSDPAYVGYASALDRLLAEQGVSVDARFVDVPMRGTGEARTIRTFVMEAGSGTPVVFLNGTPATSAVWVPLIARATGICAIVVDRPGHGLSGECDYADVPDIRPHAVSFLEALLDALGVGPAVLVGNSFGGLWSLWLAHDRPHRVSGVVLPGLPPGLLESRLPPIFGLLSVPWLSWLMRHLDPPRPSATRRMFAMMGDPPAQLSEAFVDAYTMGQQLPNVLGGTVHLIHHVRFPGRLSDSLLLDRVQLGRLAQPTLLLAGRKDFLGDLDHAQRMASAIPSAQLVEVGVGHLPWLQDPDLAAHAIERFVGTVAGIDDRR